jgi:hypothetical protein
MTENSSAKHLGNFHSRTVHFDIIKALYLPIDAQEFCLKINIKFTSKMLRHVSV